MKVTSGDLLEFESLKALLGRFIASPLGAAELEQLRPSTDRQALEEILSDTAEAIEHERALERPQPAARGSAVRIRFSDITDCRESLAKLKIEGSVLEGTEILAITNLLASALEVRSALAFSEDTCPRLARHAATIGDFRPVLRDLSGKIQPDGTLADDASVALKRLRRDVERQQHRIHDSLERFLRTHREEDILQEEFVTIRNERFVVPIVTGKQNRVDGVIHASSGTGHTLFLEPLETIGLNNELVRISEEELREVHRILREMTNRLRSVAVEIAESMKTLGELELLFAKARFAVKFGAVIPLFSTDEERRLRLADARHPLLQDVLERQHREIVPGSLTLDNDRRTLLISGPNTGGKTVTLKTVGLLALMAQSGIPVTCGEAEFPIFDEVLADIGDNQSIQESLSTFSAHIARIREMVADATSGSLVLLDELGRATDPEEGGALGVAVLENFRAAGAFTLASTHLLALKVYGANTPGVVNAAVGFDEETLQPTYHLRTGAPGKSAGLDIATRLGLPASLIERARSAMSSSERDIALFLNQLHARLEKVGELEKDLEERNAELDKRRKNLAKRFRQREKEKLAKIERKAEALIAEFEERAGQTIDAIENSAAERKAASTARRKVAKTKREFEEQLTEHILDPSPNKPGRAKLEVGVRVRLRGIHEPARLRRLLGDDVIEVESGFLKLQVPMDEVVEVLPEESTPARLPRNVTMEAGPKAYVNTQEVNVIGRRAEEACEEGGQVPGHRGTRRGGPRSHHPRPRNGCPQTGNRRPAGQQPARLQVLPRLPGRGGHWRNDRRIEGLAERRENFLGVPGDLHLGEDLADLSVLVDEERGTHYTHVGPAVVLLLLPDAVRLRDLFLGVGQERERQFVLLLELGLLVNRVRRHAENYRVDLAKLGQVVAKCASLFRAAGRVGLGIEVEDDVLPFQLLQLQRLSAVSFHFEVWGGVPFFQYLIFLGSHE